MELTVDSLLDLMHTETKLVSRYASCHALQGPSPAKSERIAMQAYTEKLTNWRLDSIDRVHNSRLPLNRFQCVFATLTVTLTLMTFDPKLYHL